MRNQRKKATISAAFAVVLLTALACVCTVDPPVTPSATEEQVEPEDLGTISLESTRVEYGPSLNALHDLAGDETLLSESAVAVTEGGEALLDFGGQMVLRVYNNSELGVAITPDPTVPIAVQGTLFKGVVTGDLVREGKRTEWTTPSGAEITISGTEFFVAYNETTGETSVGNFGGTIEVSDASFAGLGVPSGQMVVLPAGDFFSLPLTRGDFEGQIRDVPSPLRALDEFTRNPATVFLTYSGEPFSDTRVRDAILLSGDWRGNISEFRDTGDIFIVNAADPALIEPLEIEGFSPEDANVLFDEAGFIPDTDGIRLRINLFYEIDEAQAFASAAGIITELLSITGVDAQLLPLDGNTPDSAFGEAYWAISTTPPQ